MAENSSWLKGGILNLLERITLLDRVTLVDTLTAITLLDRVTLIDTLTAITNPVEVKGNAGAVPVPVSGTVTATPSGTQTVDGTGGTFPVAALRINRSTANVAAAEGAPAGDAAGVSCEGYSRCAVALHTVHADITDYDWEAWLYDGTEWAQAIRSDGNYLAVDGNTGTAAIGLDVAGFQRVALRVDTINTGGATTIGRTYTVAGPGV